MWQGYLLRATVVELAGTKDLKSGDLYIVWA